MGKRNRLYFCGLICLLVALSSFNASAIQLEQDGLEIKLRELNRVLDGVLSFDLQCRNKSSANKTLIGSILVYNTDGAKKIGDAVVYLEINKGESTGAQFHAFLPANTQPGRWELAIDEVYDFTLEELEAGVYDIATAAGTENTAPTAQQTLDGEWIFSGDPRWRWVFSTSGSLQIRQQQKEGERLLMPDAFGTYSIKGDILTIIYDDLTEWPDSFQIRGEQLTSKEYILTRNSSAN